VAHGVLSGDKGGIQHNRPPRTPHDDASQMVMRRSNCKIGRILTGGASQTGSITSQEQAMSRQEGHFMHEADIGSGEKKPGEQDTQKEVEKISNPQMKETRNTPDDPELKDDPNYQARSKPHPERR
jgi:hypothetical protein